MDPRTRTKQLGAKEKATRKNCGVRFSIARSDRVFQKNYMRTVVRKLLRMGLVLASVWERQAVGSSDTERLKLRRQMAAAAGKNELVSLSLFMDIYIYIYIFWRSRRNYPPGPRSFGRKAWRKQVFEVQTQK